MGRLALPPSSLSPEQLHALRPSVTFFHDEQAIHPPSQERLQKLAEGLKKNGRLWRLRWTKVAWPEHVKCKAHERAAYSSEWPDPT
mmetsp:Transcript_46291/g.89119  ORF Transcript_46291/g.89119 Transcript_46291/m.89119 type:complete len:86 (+) Transcript_46291:75-332(+)